MASFLVGSAIGRYDIRDGDALKRLLARIAANRVIDPLRRPEFRGPAPAVVGTGSGEFEPVAVQSGPESRIARSGLIEKADRMLTDRERMALLLRDVEGLPAEEVAERLNCSKATVRSHIANARVKFRRYLERRQA